MIPFGATGSGVSVLLKVKLWPLPTVVFQLELAVVPPLLSAMLAVLAMTVPFGSGLTTFTTSVAVAAVPGARLPNCQRTKPVLPTGGAWIVPAPLADANVVLTGVLSSIVTLCAVSLPVTV
jgi:hypothetical protein